MNLIKPTVKLPVWPAAHANALVEFLGTPAGQNFIEVLTFERSDFPAPGSPDLLYQNGEVKGYEKCLTNLLLLRQPIEPEKPDNTSGNYPDINDDKKWQTQ